ncbi:MAG TPA: agmatinase [Stellaceae bacterium]|nr:agmatinase [Stellaceae bacterium]
MADLLPTSSLDVPRFVGVANFMRLPTPKALDGLDVGIIGLPCDSGAPFRTGARFGPGAIRAISVMLRPVNPYHGNINVFETLAVGDVGDAPVVPGYLEASFERIEMAMGALVERGIIPFGIGGDHSVSLPELRALSRRHGKLALVHFDSHTDTWDKYFAGKRHSAGTPFRRAVEEGLVTPERSIQIGMRGSLFTPADITQSLDLGYEVVTTDEIFAAGFPALADRIRRRVGDHPAFLTFDMDFVDPASAPGVETPEAGGPTARETLQIVRGLTGLNFVGADLVEVCPSYDNASQVTALLGATIIAEFLALLALRKRR